MSTHPGSLSQRLLDMPTDETSNCPCTTRPRSHFWEPTSFPNETIHHRQLGTPCEKWKFCHRCDSETVVWHGAGQEGDRQDHRGFSRYRLSNLLLSRRDR